MFPFHFHQKPTNFTIPPTYPRICVTSNAYAWPTHPPPHSTHFLSNTPTHMRVFLRICVGLTPNTQSHSPKPLPNPLSTTHMRTTDADFQQPYYLGKYTESYQ
ncbi:hypothetical protein PIB30_100155, partial [Stylosanthes scabra]|nr:hypothetical protein [Stylosanthes scabra]